jgi:signal transduction histidine kinase
VELWAMMSLFSFKGKRNVRQGLLTFVDITTLKQIDIAKTEFVSLASHQLRTPISGMKWNVELLLTTEKAEMSEKHQKYIEKIARSLEQMNALVDDFLSASKFELGTLKPVVETFTSTDFFAKILEEYKEVSLQKGVRIDSSIASFSITSDSHLLHMVVSNLVGNAVKYTGNEGTVGLTVTEDGRSMTISVSDTGIGIPLSDQATIFSKMFRATNARNHASGGTGLGLYIAKEATHILSGTIEFISKEGEGTVFTVVLPTNLTV